MIFKTTILARNGTEWAFLGEILGHGMYDDDGNRSFFVIENFNIVNIIISNGKEILKVENYRVMPDMFNEQEICALEKEAEEKFLEDWMDVQECAHDLLIYP